MANPWESYQSTDEPAATPESGPWQQYATSQQPELTQDQAAIVSQSENKIKSIQADLDKLNQVRNNPNALEQVFGGLESFLALTSGIGGTIASGVVGLADAANPFAPEGAGAARQKQVQEALTFEPQLPSGKGVIENVAGFIEGATDLGTKAVAATTGAIKGGLLRDPTKALETYRNISERGVGEAMGSDVAEFTGSPFLGSIARAIPTAALLASPIKNLGRGKPTVQQVAQQQATRQLSEPFSKQMSQADQTVAKLILEKSDDISTAKVKLSVENLKSKLTDGLAKVVNDKDAIQAMKQGFSEKSTAIVKAANETEKSQFRKMVDIAGKGLKSGTDEALNRVGDVVGKTLLNRVDAAIKLNRRAGENIDKVAKSELAGSYVNTSPAMRSFISDLTKMDIKLSQDFRALSFTGSAIEGGVPGAATAQKILQLTLNRLNQVSGKDNALKSHKLKRFIDQQVTFGKTSSGGRGAAEPALKNLRRNINLILGDKFPKYREVNTKFSETREVLDNFQKAAGTSIDFTSKFAEKGLGTKMRSLTSNNLTRSRLLNAMSGLEDILVKNGVKFKDRIIEQAIIANDLEALLKLTPKTGFKGQIAAAGAEAAAGSTMQAGIKAGRTVVEKLTGKSPENAIKAIKKLLKKAK